MALGFESMRPLPQQAVASYAVRVPRTGSLLSAFFRFLLAAFALAVRLGVAFIKVSAGTLIRQSHPGSRSLAGSQHQAMTLRASLTHAKKRRWVFRPSGAWL